MASPQRDVGTWVALQIFSNARRAKEAAPPARGRGGGQHSQNSFYSSLFGGNFAIQFAVFNVDFKYELGRKLLPQDQSKL